MRYRGKTHVLYEDGSEKEIDTIVKADDMETALKKYIIEINGTYRDNKRVVGFSNTSFDRDDSIIPSEEYVTRLLLKANTREGYRNASFELMESFYNYNPCSDGDQLASVLSYCKNEQLEALCRKMEHFNNLQKGEGLGYIVHFLLKELDDEWFYSYSPQMPLDEQYAQAI